MDTHATTQDRKPAIGDSLQVVRDGVGWMISIGRSFTTFQLRLEDIDSLFADGFE